MRIPWIERDLLYGANLVHDKAQLGTAMSAERAIKREAVKLQGGKSSSWSELRNGRTLRE